MNRSDIDDLVDAIARYGDDMTEDILQGIWLELARLRALSQAAGGSSGLVERGEQFAVADPWTGGFHIEIVYPEPSTGAPNALMRMKAPRPWTLTRLVRKHRYIVTALVSCALGLGVWHAHKTGLTRRLGRAVTRFFTPSPCIRSPNTLSGERRRNQVIIILGADSTPLGSPLISSLASSGFIVIASVRDANAASTFEVQYSSGWVKYVALDPENPMTIPSFIRSLQSALSLRFPLEVPNSSTSVTSPGSPSPLPTDLQLHSVISLLSLCPPPPHSPQDPPSPSPISFTSNTYTTYHNSTHITPLQAIHSLLPLLRQVGGARARARAQDLTSSSSTKNIIGGGTWGGGAKGQSIIICLPHVPSASTLQDEGRQVSKVNAAATACSVDILRARMKSESGVNGVAADDVKDVRVVTVDVHFDLAFSPLRPQPHTEDQRRGCSRHKRQDPVDGFVRSITSFVGASTSTARSQVQQSAWSSNELYTPPKICTTIGIHANSFFHRLQSYAYFIHDKLQGDRIYVPGYGDYRGKYHPLLQCLRKASLTYLIGIVRYFYSPWCVNAGSLEWKVGVEWTGRVGRSVTSRGQDHVRGWRGRRDGDSTRSPSQSPYQMNTPLGPPPSLPTTAPTADFRSSTATGATDQDGEKTNSRDNRSPSDSESGVADSWISVEE